MNTIIYNGLTLIEDPNNLGSPLISLAQLGGTLIQTNFKYAADNYLKSIDLEPYALLTGATFTGSLNVSVASGRNAGFLVANTGTGTNDNAAFTLEAGPTNQTTFFLSQSNYATFPDQCGIFTNAANGFIILGSAGTVLVKWDQSGTQINSGALVMTGHEIILGNNSGTNAGIYAGGSTITIDGGPTAPGFYTTFDITGLDLVNVGGIQFYNLPTSSSGLASGSVWNNGGILNIV